MSARARRNRARALSDYKKGDPAPTGYIAWHAWADVQHRAGLRQKQCARCLLWYFPQEAAAHRSCEGKKPAASLPPASVD